MKVNTDLDFIRAHGYYPAQELSSIVLVGGKGTRLTDDRKRITPETFPKLNPDYWNTIGPKGLAIINAKNNSNQCLAKPLTNWHLDIHCAVPQIHQITLGLGFQGAVLQNYYETSYQSVYKSRKLNYLVEKNPAGTLAPIVELSCRDQLPDTPLVYANGDSLMDLDLYQCYLSGLRRALQAKLDLRMLVIIVATLIPAAEASDYGVLELEFGTDVVKAFREKQATPSPDTFLNLNGQLMVPINAGFSIINHPHCLFSRYLSPEIIQTSQLLNGGLIDYPTHEHLVKYESLFGRIASEGHVVAVVLPNAWCDLGTEARIRIAEVDFLSSLQSLTQASFL